MSESGVQISQELADMFSRLAEVTRPRGTGPVAISPHFNYIVECGLRGYTPVQIVNELSSQVGNPNVTPEQISSYFAENLPPELRLPARQLQQFSRSGPVQPFTTLLELLAFQRYRVGEAVIQNVGVDSEQVRREVDLCARLCKDVINIGQSVGDIPMVEPQRVTPVRKVVVEAKPSESLSAGDFSGYSDAEEVDLSNISASDAKEILTLLCDT